MIGRNATRLDTGRSQHSGSAAAVVAALTVAVSACGSSPDAAVGTSTATQSTATQSTAPVDAPAETSVVGTTPVADAATSTAAPIAHLPGSIAIAFDVTRNDNRPLKETLVPIRAAIDVLSMKVTGIAYRGMICGFSIQGEAPPSPVTIRQVVATPTGTFDSGPLEVSWTSLDDVTVTAATAQVDTWNFSAEAHVNRSGPGWVVSIGGVTPPAGGDDSEVTPTDGACELRSANPVFTPKVGPVGYWAGFATV